MGRAPCCEKVGLKRGRWTAEEDDILTKYIQTNGEGSWRSLPKNAGLLRCGKSCRLRWVNYLKSDLKRGKFSKDEDETIIKLHSSLGNRWCLIASHLPGRTDNEIKNYWNSHLSRQIYNFRKIIQQIKQTIAPKHRVGRTSRSAMKKNKSHISAKPPAEALSEKSVELTSSSQEVECGAGDASVLMPATPALEENVVSCMLMEMDKDNESIDDLLLGSYFDNTVFDELEVGPPEIPDAQGQDQNSTETMFSNEEVENWLIDTDFRMQSSGDLSLVSDGGDQLYQCDTKYTSPDDELDILGWDMGNLDWDSGIIDQEQKLWDSEEEKLLSWLWESDDCDGSISKVESEPDSDKHDAIVEWLLS